MAPKQQESQQDDVDESATRRHWHEVNLRASYNDISSASCKPAGRPLDYPTTHFDIAVQPKLSTVMWPTQTPGEYVEKQYPNVLHGLHRLERGYLLEKEQGRGRFGIVFIATVLRGEKRPRQESATVEVAWDDNTGPRETTSAVSLEEEDEVTWYATSQKAAVKVVLCHDLPTAHDATEDGHTEDVNTGSYNHPLLEIAATRLVGGGYDYYEGALGYHDCVDDKIGAENGLAEEAEQECHIESAIEIKKSFSICKYEAGIHNVTRLLDAYVDATHIFIVMPYYQGGELFHKLQKKGTFDEAESRYWFKQILQGLSTFHARGMCHLDLSLENVMIDHSYIDDGTGNVNERLGRAVIIDLGSSLRVPFHARLRSNSFSLHPEKDDSAYVGNGCCYNNNTNKVDSFDVVNGGLRCIMSPLPTTIGKIAYLPPEFLPSSEGEQREPFDPFAVDLWASAVMLFTMLAGVEPWKEPNNKKDHKFRMVQNNGVETLFKGRDITWLSEEVINLLNQMLKADPRERLSLGEVLEHPWVTKKDD
uniref:non-specific serine/threonine protein kinase n=1 Tax=Ditylum brightwellii TaxID=49249 RepID=A0A6U3Z2T7_9STRA|mmetsp:Transcript_2667/g.4116  ORF Transcript_2667/g.4116 Transcript_2667/m.4116 type:complete len:534 (+) Transcript_2667:80-1681(+)